MKQILLAIVTLLPALPSALHAADAAPGRPNILYQVADDLGNADIIGENGNFTIGNIRLHAELALTRPACLWVDCDLAKLYINTFPDEVWGRKISVPIVPSTLLAEKHEGNVSVMISETMPPTL